MATTNTNPASLTVGDISDDTLHKVDLVGGINTWVLNSVNTPPPVTAYTSNFVVADWVVGAINSVITIPFLTHKIKSPDIEIMDATSTEVGLDKIQVLPTHDIVLEVVNGFAFDGKYIIK